MAHPAFPIALFLLSNLPIFGNDYAPRGRQGLTLGVAALGHRCLPQVGPVNRGYSQIGWGLYKCGSSSGIDQVVPTDNRASGGYDGRHLLVLVVGL